MPLLTSEELASIMAQQGAEGGEGPSEEGGSEGGPSSEEEGGSSGPSEEGGYSPEDESRSGPPEESYRQETPNYGPPPGYSPRDEPQARREYAYQDEINHGYQASNAYKSGQQYYRPDSSQREQTASAGYVQDGNRPVANDGRQGRVHVYGHYQANDDSSVVPAAPVSTSGAGYRAQPSRDYQNAAPAAEVIYGRRMSPMSDKAQAAVAANPTGNPTHNGKYIIQK